MLQVAGAHTLDPAHAPLMTSTTRLLMIGLDSADRGLIDRWMREGHLPVLAGLRARGSFGELDGPPAMGDDAAWATFYTGVSPARHGRYSYCQVFPGDYGVARFREEHLRAQPFWVRLGRQGYRLAVVDVPKCPVLADWNGIQLADWLVHGRDQCTRSWPPELAPAVLGRYGNDHTDDNRGGGFLCHFEALNDVDLEQLIEHSLDSVERKLSLALDWLQDGEWDLFLTVFKESHCIGHQGWRVLDQHHPEYDAGLAARWDQPVRRVYQALDCAVGRLIEAAGAEADVMVFSDLGMAANHSGNHLLDRVLLRVDRHAWLERWLLFSAAAVPHLPYPIAARMRRFKRNLQGLRRAFQVPHNEMSGAIRLNIRGRERYGRVNAGRDAEQLCEQLTAALLELVNPDTGAALVKTVHRSRQLFSGEQQDALPDLLVEWANDGPVTAAASPAIGVVRVPVPHYRPGNHVAGGFYFSAGPHLAAAAEPVHGDLTDLAPTAAALLGASLDQVDGFPLPILRSRSGDLTSIPGAGAIRSGARPERKAYP